MSNTKTRTKTRWTREFKLQALSRMEAATDVTALAAELGCRRELLYIWRRKVRAGGADSLHPMGRPSHADRPFDAASAPSLACAVGAEPQRIAELQRLIGQQQADLAFFRAALRVAVSIGTASLSNHQVQKLKLYHDDRKRYGGDRAGIELTIGADVDPGGYAAWLMISAAALAAQLHGSSV